MRKWTEQLRESTTKYLESLKKSLKKGVPGEKFFNMEAPEDKNRLLLNIGTVIDRDTFENISKASAQ